MLKKIRTKGSSCIRNVPPLSLAVMALLSANNSQAETFLNTAPDCSQAVVSPDRIWPPEGTMIPLTISGVTDPDNQLVELETQCVVQDEPYLKGDRDIGLFDADGIGTDSPSVRAYRHMQPFYNYDTEKWEKAGGRVYQVIFKATDSSGSMCSGTVKVEVPHSESKVAIDNGVVYPSAADGVNCNALPINNPPIIYSQAPTEGQVGNLFEYNVLGHDPDIADRDSLSYELISPPIGMTINAESGLIQWTPIADQQGLQEVTVKVQDVGGLSAVQSFNVDVLPAVDNISASIIANPESGISPLKVRFSPEVENNNLTVSKYRWDFNGDGTYDAQDTFGKPRSYTYSGNPGDSFTAKLQVVFKGGETVEATKVISLINEAPVAYVTADATNGHAPLNVNFTVDASDPQGISQISIDFDADGVVDETREVSGTNGSWSFSTSYSVEGTYAAIVTVQDGLGEQIVVTNNGITVDVNDPLDPVIQISASPNSGNVPLSSTLNASAELFDGSAITAWSWDLDGDGTFETNGGNASNEAVTYVYSSVDDFYPVVQVETDSGRTAKASLRIHTDSSAKPTVSVPNSSDTINADNGQVASFTVGLPYKTSLSVWMEDSSGQLVKTLLDSTDTDAGNHSFEWDGTDESGQTVSPADYYVVVGYTKYGKPYEVDLRTSSGGSLYYYRRTTNNPRSFDRIENPLKVNFAVSNPAEVTFFWQVSFGAKLMTIMEHERMGRGNYSVYWNGEYPNGKKISNSVTRLLPGIVFYTLANNVIFVKENTRIENYVLESTILHDPRREPIGLNLTIGKPSTVEMIVSDMDKGVDVATRIFSNVPAGDVTLEWDGRNNEGEYLAPGDYRVGVRSVDEKGNRSLYWYRTQRINY
ncbi:MAG: FlgD immunoglobulin-like domain containing protein [Neptuniibacter sp.]